MVIHRKSISVKIKKRHENTNLKRGQIVSYASQSRLSLVSIVTLSNSLYVHASVVRCLQDFSQTFFTHSS